jgi:hypothetical protein
VPLDVFRGVVSALEEKLNDIKDRNFSGLWPPSKELGFQALSAKL